MSDDELAAVKRHNAWVEELQHDIEWAPLREFVGLLRESEPALTSPEDLK